MTFSNDELKLIKTVLRLRIAKLDDLLERDELVDADLAYHNRESRVACKKLLTKMETP